MFQVVGELPELQTLYEYEDYAKHNGPPKAWAYFSSVATYGTTAQNNEDYLQRIRLRPRHMIPVPQFHPSLAVLGLPVSMPIGFSPVASQDLIREEGVIAVARAAQSAGIIHIVSQWAGVPLEDIRAAAPNATFWQQVSLPNNNFFFLPALS